jgi:rare lipoprotein A
MPNTGVWRGLQGPARCGALALGCLALAHCGSQDQLTSRIDPKYGVASSPRVVEFGEPVPKGGGTYRIGKPYVVAGITYVPEENPNYRAEGLASFYGQDFHGRRTANGEVFDMESLSAAHPTLPIPCYARVTNLANHRSVIVRINDRGPYHGNRLVDVSMKTAHVLGFHQSGVARVRVEFVGPASLEGSDDHMLMATYREGEPAPAPSRVMLASARPFLPQTQTPIIADVPLPASRPFSLGEGQDVAQAPAAQPVAAQSQKKKLQAARNDISLRPRSLQDQARDLSGGPVTAYAPMRDNSALAPVPVASGRGLN